MNFEIKGRHYRLVLGNWFNLLHETEEKIKNCKKITRATHDGGTPYVQSKLMQEKQKATLLYLMRGHSRGRLTHFGADSLRHTKTLEWMLKTGWAQEVISYCLKELPHPADVPIASINLRKPDDNYNTMAANGANRAEADRGKRVGIVSAALGLAANLLPRLQSAIRGTDSP